MKHKLVFVRKEKGRKKRETDRYRTIISAFMCTGPDIIVGGAM